MARLPKFLPICALLCVTAFAQSGAKNRIVQEIDGSQMTSLRGSVHPQARPEFDHGRLSVPLRLNGASLYFAPSASQKAALRTLQAQQHDPASPNYHRWLSPEEYAERFGMSTDDLAKVTAWLTSQGLKVDGVSRSRNRVSFSGTTAQIESIFRTEFHQYLVKGEKHFANATELYVPEALSGAVLGFRNLDDFRLKPKNVRMVTPKFTSNVSGNTFLAPADVATIYNISPLYTAGFDGTGQRIAVAGQTAISLSDVNAFRSASGLSVNPPQLLLVPNSGSSTTFTGDLGEAHLDVEWSGGVAKNATIIYVYTGSSATKNVIDAFEYAIDNNLAPVISISYGNCEALIGSSNIAILQSDAQQADTQGQTISAASGDDGATDCESSTASFATHGLAVDIPGAIAEVTSVGGTTFTGDANHNPTYWLAVNDPTTGGSALQYIPETTWNDAIARGDLSSTGGGVSSVIPKPTWQNGKTPADGKRDVPDIALSASPEHDPYLFCTQGSCVNGFRTANGDLAAVGGTSAGAPVFAGIVALLNQATQHSSGQGKVNPTLYSLAGTSAFHDITTGNNKELCQTGSTDCTSANSHVAALNGGHLPIYGGLMLIPFGAICISLRRKYWAPFAAGILVLVALALLGACGGGSSTPPPPPPPSISIGYSAAAGYDLTTGLGSLDTMVMANAWPGYTTSPAYDLTSAPPSLTGNAGSPSVATVTITRMNGFNGTVNLTCQAIPLSPETTCSVNPTSVTLSSGTTSPNVNLTVTGASAGGHLAVVTGKSGTVSHSVNVKLTVN